MNSSTSSEDLPIKLIDDKVKSDEKHNKNNDIIKLKDKNDKNDKKETEDTDLYFNLIANDVKKQPEPKESSSAISVSSSSSSSSKKTSSVKRRTKKSSSSSSRRSSSSKKSSSSKAKFDKIKTNTNNSKSDDIRKKFNTNNSKSDDIRKNFLNSNNDYQQSIPVLNPQEDKMKKIELLRRLSEIKAKGYDLSKSYDFNSSIKEMEYEYELLRSFADKRNGIRLYKNILLNTTSVIEFLNDRYDPFNFQLSGWSEHMSVECDSYEDVLEELYEKYKGNGKRMSPELKLFLLIMASASAFHFSKSTYNKMPMMETLLKKNPSFVANMINPKKPKSQFMTEQEIHLEKQKEMIRERERNKRNNISTQKHVSKPEKKVRQNVFAAENARKQAQINRNSLNINHNIPRENMESKQINRIFNENTRIHAPENVSDILRRLHERKEESVGATTQEESSISNNNDRVVSDSTLTSDTAGKKKRRARKKKSLLTII
jgi:hypothetical protein